MPESPKKKNFSSIEQEPVSRRQKIEANGGEINLPPIEHGVYLIDYLWEVGTAVPAGFGLSAVTFAELYAWQKCAGIDLLPWEVRILRLLSSDYVAESKRAEKPDSPAPFSSDTILEFDRAIVAKQVGDALKAFARAKRR